MNVFLALNTTWPNNHVSETCLVNPKRVGVGKFGGGVAFKYVIRKSNEKHKVIDFFPPEKVIQ